MKSHRLPIVAIAILLCVASGLVFAQDAAQEPIGGTTVDYSRDRLQYEGQVATPEPTVPAIPESMESALVPCTAESTGPCDLIATSAEDIAGVWKQYLQGPFFNAPGEVAYIRFNAVGTFTVADSIENTAQPFSNYPTGTFAFDGQRFSTPVVLNDNVPAPCVLETDAYQARVMMYGDQPVALRFVFISDGCLGRVQDWTQPLIWVAPSQ